MLAGGGLDRIRPPEQAETLKADRADKRRGDRAAEPDAARGGTAANRLGIPDKPRLLGRGQGSQIDVKAGGRVLGVAMSGILGDAVGERVPVGEGRVALADQPVGRERKSVVG